LDFSFGRQDNRNRRRTLMAALTSRCQHVRIQSLLVQSFILNHPVSSFPFILAWQHEQSALVMCSLTNTKIQLLWSFRIKDLDITGASPRKLRDKFASPYAMTHSFCCSLFFVPVIGPTTFSMALCFLINLRILLFGYHQSWL
jgi:hypothetical protein